MKQQIDNIFSWFNGLSTFVKVVSSLIVLGTWTLSGIGIYNNWIIKKHDSSITIDLKHVKDTLTLQSIWMKGIDDKIKNITDEFITTKSNVTTLTGSYNALDRSYVRTLEKTLKSNEELSKYKDDKIQELQEALQKKN